MDGDLDQGGSADNRIREDPPAPPNGRELVRARGAETVRAAMPEGHQNLFDAAHPYTPIDTAHARLDNLYTQMDAYQQTGQNAPVRLLADLQTAAQESRGLLDRYNRDLGSYVDRNHVNYADGTRGRLLDHITSQLGYSTPAQNAQIAGVASSHGRGHRGGGRRDGDGDGGSRKRNPLQPVSGNRRKRA